MSTGPIKHNGQVQGTDAISKTSETAAASVQAGNNVDALTANVLAGSKASSHLGMQTFDFVKSLT